MQTLQSTQALKLTPVTKAIRYTPTVSPGSFAVSVALFALLFLSTGGSIIATHREVRHYLGMQDYIGLVPEHIEDALLQQLPIGSSLADVRHYLDARSIGRDNRSACFRTDQRSIVCILGIDHHRWELLRESYGIKFLFDASGKLQSLQASRHMNDAVIRKGKGEHA
jgi:hypothetical protein